MAYIRTVPDDEATGGLAQLYSEARRRAGKVFNILRCMSLAPEHMRASIDLYLAVMYGQSPLSRAQREMIAVAVSVLNKCHY
ncbi:MAG: carboxymuconolactone decarboxylase family protein [Armatimonadetes bacterium]|nr:carboxymuconolactone decarboxylase family protein [Armatimonadota bacterium]